MRTRLVLLLLPSPVQVCVVDLLVLLLLPVQGRVEDLLVLLLLPVQGRVEDLLALLLLPVQVRVVDLLLLLLPVQVRVVASYWWGTLLMYMHANCPRLTCSREASLANHSATAEPNKVGYGARFRTAFCTRGCHWIPCLFA
jgi:hypothetical protein